MKLANFTREHTDVLAGGPSLVASSAVSTHEAGTASLHVATAVTIADAGGFYATSTVEGALQEIGTVHRIYDEGSLAGTATAGFNFVGSNVSGTVTGGTAIITVSGSSSSLVVYDEGVLVGTPTAMDFIGSGVSAALSGGTAQVTVTVGTASTNIPIYDEGSLMGTATAGLNFVGSGVSSTVTSGTAVITISGGTASSGTSFYLDTYSAPLDGTMGDHFEGTALGTAWSRRNLLAADETYQAGGGSWLSVNIGTATAAAQYYQSCPAGDWEFIAAFSSTGATNQQRMVGLGVVDSSGNGRAICFYTDGLSYLGVITTNAYTTYSSVVGYAYTYMSGAKTWARIRKSGNTIYASQSFDGMIWSREKSVSDSSTWSQVFIGRVYGTQTDEQLNLDLFDRVA